MKKIEKRSMLFGILIPSLLLFSLTAEAQSNYRRSDKKEVKKETSKSKSGGSAKSESKSHNSVYVPSVGARGTVKSVKIYKNGGTDHKVTIIKKESSGRVYGSGKSSQKQGTFRPEPRPSVHNDYGERLNSLPGDPVIIHRGGMDYYFSNGKYFLRRSGAYYVCRPPIGSIIAASLLRETLHLTDYVVKSAFGIRQRYYTDDDGIYYVKSGNVFIVVDPPVGAILYQLPAGYTTAEINGTSYYVVGDNYYIADVDSYGRPFFRYVGSLSRY